MPLKWKIYNACATYLLVWGTAFSLWGVYKTIENGVVNNDTIGIVVLFSILAIIIAKAVLSLKAIRHYKEATLPGRAEKVLFIIAFCFIVLFNTGALLAAIFFIIPEIYRRDYNTNAPGLLEVVLVFGLFAAGVVSVYLVITDLMLLKAIRKKQQDNLLSFEIETNHQKRIIL